MEIFSIIGWLACLIPLGWASMSVFFVTVPTFSEALFSMKWPYKLLGGVLWIILISFWILWLSVIKIDI